MPAEHCRPHGLWPVLRAIVASSVRSVENLCESGFYPRGATVQHSLWRLPNVRPAPRTRITDLRLEIPHQASRGSSRVARRILNMALHRAVPKGLNHLPDEILQQATEKLR